MNHNLLKQRLAAKEPSYIFGVRTTRTANLVAIAQAAGYDAIYVDFQHSAIGMETAGQIFQAALHAGITALARVPEVDAALVGRILDSGAHGVMAADLRSAAQARELTQAALLAPLGNRSLGMPVDPRFPGLAGAALMEAINASTLLIAMIETDEGLAEASAIVSTPGIDALQIGSSDLTASMGIPGQYGHPRLVEAYQKVAAACRTAGKPFVVGGIRKPGELAPYLGMGAARCYFTGSDTGFMLDGGRAARERAEQADREARQSPGGARG